MKNKKNEDMALANNAFHPGAYLLEEIQAREITQKDLATRVGVAKNVMSDLIHGRRNFTPALAIKLEEVLGVDAEMWLSLQSRYDIAM